MGCVCLGKPLRTPSAKLGLGRTESKCSLASTSTRTLGYRTSGDTLLAHMKEKGRYNIRLAGRRGVRVYTAQTIEDVRNWYGLLQTTSVRDNFGIHTLEYYLRAWQIFSPRNQARLFLADYDGQLLAGIFVGLIAKQAIYLYGASSN